MVLLRVVHRDLAARNVLVGAQGRKLKISDFGRTRATGTEQGYYRKESRDAVPIKWMAPEVLREQCYTSQSDVYAAFYCLHSHLHDDRCECCDVYAASAFTGGRTEFCCGKSSRLVAHLTPTFTSGLSFMRLRRESACADLSTVLQKCEREMQCKKFC